MDSTADSPADSPADSAVDATPAAKRLARSRARHARAHRTPERDARDARILVALITELDERGPGGEIAAYDPLPGEPGGHDLPDRLAATGRTVWLPVVVGAGLPLRWVRWRGATFTRTGAFGIREPVPDGGDTAIDSEDLLARVDSLIIPALAVGADGVRLGQGGGFYDRTFATSMSTAGNRDRLIAVVDHEEYGVHVPATTLDITVTVVVTDAGSFRTDIAAGSVRP